MAPLTAISIASVWDNADGCRQCRGGNHPVVTSVSISDMICQSKDVRCNIAVRLVVPSSCLHLHSLASACPQVCIPLRLHTPAPACPAARKPGTRASSAILWLRRSSAPARRRARRVTAVSAASARYARQAAAPPAQPWLPPRRHPKWPRIDEPRPCMACPPRGPSLTTLFRLPDPEQADPEEARSSHFASARLATPPGTRTSVNRSKETK